jgi:hypothetical protein
MDSEVTMTIAGSVVVVCQLLKSVGLHGKWALVVAALLSLAGTAFVAWAAADFSRASAIRYLIGWTSVLSSAAGVFGMINAAPEAVATIKGGVKGAASNLMQSFKE